jgi:hypothetical protein
MFFVLLMIETCYVAQKCGCFLRVSVLCFYVEICPAISVRDVLCILS